MAIRIADPQYAGSRVTGFKVDLPVKEDAVDNVTGWLSTELKVTDGVNAPDITTVPGETDGQLVLNVTFPTPYTITDAGVWVGYSFDITSLKASPGSYPGSPHRLRKNFRHASIRTVGAQQQEASGVV